MIFPETCCILRDMMLSLLSLALAFESDPVDVTLQDRAELFTNTEFSTGIIPSGSPVGVQFRIEANGGANITMEGIGNLTWPEALTLAFTGDPGTGVLLLNGSLAAVTEIVIDLSDYGYEGSFEIDRRDIRFDGTKFFDPFVMDGATTDRVEIVDTTDSAQLIYYDWEIITGLSLKFQADMTPTFTVGFEGVSWTNNEGYASHEGQAMDLAPEQVADYDVASTFRGAWDSTFSLVFTPEIQACAVILGCITVAQFDFPLDLAVDTFEQDFPSQLLTFPLPWLNPGLSEGDFGDVEPGSQAVINFAITNEGNLGLYGNAVIIGEGEFSVFPEDFNALAGTTDGLSITFSPTSEGSQSANLVLYSNDPNLPELTIPLYGNGVPDEVDPGGNGDTGKVTAEVTTCGCSSNQSMAWSPLLLLLGGLFLRRRSH